MQRNDVVQQDPVAGVGVLAGHVSLCTVDGRPVLVLRGEIDAAVLEDFRARSGAQPPVVHAIDAGGVTYMCAAGLCLLVTTRAASRAAGSPGHLLARSPAVDRLIALSGLAPAFASS